MARTKPQRNPERLDIRMSFTVRYGEQPEDELVVMREREMKLIGSVFRYRDKIMQTLATTLVRVALLQPKIARRVVGATRTVRRTPPKKR
ncbi:hypothetical protein [uncultured Abyssibacter sp.]|uniref:hypothetical protein n=1 Tax=uncultured Abyssibacter sp. TaxID=2320202 RepID=UPI0032B162F7